MQSRKEEKVNHLDNQQARWFAVYTKYKTEKNVVARLKKKGIESYVPLLKYTKRYTRKIRNVEIPLISCYVFVKITKDDYLRVLQTENVLHFLKIRNNLIAIPEEEMETMQWVVGENLVEKIESRTISEGQEVEVIAGNLTGLRGRVIQRKNKHQFIVNLESLAISLDITISKEMLQPIVNLKSLAMN